MSFRIVIVDDEEDAREMVKIHLARHSQLELIGEAQDGYQAIRLINEFKPDIVLLDIQMPEINGLEVINQVDHSPLFVFITAYNTFAIKAFELNAVDYLLKPFTESRFDMAIDRVQQRLLEGQMKKDFYRYILTEVNGHSFQDKPYVHRLTYKVGMQIHFVDTTDILFIEAADQYVFVHTLKQKHLLRQSMDYLEEVLNPSQFFRTHRSFIVNLNEVSSLEQLGPRKLRVHLKNGIIVKLSQVRKQLFQNKLNLG